MRIYRQSRTQYRDPMTQDILLGQTLRYSGNPFGDAGWENVTHYEREGAVLIEDGMIRMVGSREAVLKAAPNATRHDYGAHLISAGFIDAHMHYPQTAMIASWGKQLIDWLNTYTFPEESRFGDTDYAREIAERTVRLATQHGTTSLTSFCTIHPESVDAFFSAAAQIDMEVIAGKTCMDRNAPDTLRDTAQSAYDDSKRLLEKWHRNGRAHYAITPRFSPTSTPEQLEAMGALWAEHPDCLMQTHLSEQIPEIAWVRELFPEARDYLDTYEQFGLLGPKGLYGHAIYLEDREIDRLQEVDASLVHCPTSNTFIGSGLFDMQGLAGRGMRVGLATDTGGGSSFSMLRTMAAAYEIGQLRGLALHPSQLMWLATEGSARAVHREGRIGHLGAGATADLVVLDLGSTEAIAQRTDRAESIWDALFPTIMMGDDRAVSAVWINGREINR